MTEKYDQATILLQADATENDSNPLNIKSESWQILKKQGMVDVDFKIDVVETDCFVIPTEDTIGPIISDGGTTEGTTTTETMTDPSILVTTTTTTIAQTIKTTTTAMRTTSTSKSTDNIMIDCQTFYPETFYNGAQKCSNLGFRYPNQSNLDHIKNDNQEFWIGARKIDEKWTDEFNNEIDPVQPASTSFWGNIGRIFGVRDHFCLYWDKNRIQELACDKPKPIVCCRDVPLSVPTTSAKQPFPTTRVTVTAPATTFATTLPSIGAMKITTTEVLNVPQEPKDENLNILISFSCFDPSWPIFDDKTLIKLKVLDKTKCLGICQRVDQCLAFSAQENFCVFKMSSSIENLKSVTAMLSVFIG